LVLALALSLTAACAPTPAASASSTPGASPTAGGSQPNAVEKTVTIALSAAWANLNAFNVGSDLQAYVLNVLFDKLVYLDSKGNITPRLLQSWAFSEDGTVLTGQVDPRAKWQDGVPLTAHDIVFTFAILADPASASQGGLATVVGTDASGKRVEGEEYGIQALDDYTVRFTFKAPTKDISFFGGLSYQYIVPKHLLETEDPANILDSAFFTAPVGSGSFAFESQIVGTSIDLTANKDYFLGAPDFDRLVIKVVANENVLPALISGEVDVTGGNGLSNVLLSDVPLAREQANLAVESIETIGYQFAVLNTKGPLSDPRSRRAVETAINKQSIVDDILAGEGKVIYSPIAASSKYFNANLRVNAYDPAEAKRLLDEAGFDYSSTLKLLVSSGNTEREQSAVIIQQNLAAVGVTVDIVLSDHPTLQSNTRAGNYDISLMGMPGSPDPGEAGRYWYVPYPGNFAQLDEGDYTVYQHFAAAEAELDETKAKVFYDQAQQAVEDYATFLYLYNQNSLIGYNKRLSQLDFNTYFLTDKVHEWKVG
jgi:peptide/nickel transport system substrate-binding protein